MKRSELKKMLHEKNIPDYYYNIDGNGETDQMICMEFLDPKWIVFYSERGRKFDVKEFESEDEACEDLYSRIN